MNAKQICFELESFAHNLDSALDDGSRVVAYRYDEESDEMVLVLWHRDGSEEHLYPSVLDEFKELVGHAPGQRAGRGLSTEHMAGAVRRLA